MKKVKIYTDGACIDNPGYGGWCAIVVTEHGEEIVFSGGEEDTTNNRMELMAVLEPLRALREKCEIKIYSDSEYVVKGINSWMWSWAKEGWKKNKDLWQKIHGLCRYHMVDAIWVKGHVGHDFNERCDQIAKEEARKCMVDDAPEIEYDGPLDDWDF